jgi:hypothetical protein
LGRASFRTPVPGFLAFGRLALTTTLLVRSDRFAVTLLVRLRALERRAGFLAAMTLPLAEVDPSL